MSDEDQEKNEEEAMADDWAAAMEEQLSGVLAHASWSAIKKRWARLRQGEDRNDGSAEGNSTLRQI